MQNGVVRVAVPRKNDQSVHKQSKQNLAGVNNGYVKNQYLPKYKEIYS